VPAEWFRQPDWAEGAQAEFERRLRRAQARKRPQYLRIKALALRDAGDVGAATSLLERLLDEYPESLDAAFAAELIGDMARGNRDSDAAEASYRRALTLRPDLNGTSGAVHISLAEVLIEMGRYDDAVEVLGMRPLSSLTMNAARFRWNAALAHAASAIGEHDVAKQAAGRALDLLDAPDQFPRHPGVGRPSPDAADVERLRRLVAGDLGEPSGRRRWRLRRT
jgi:predicted Zn-dependent protease